jgi:hypothetical protein
MLKQAEVRNKDWFAALFAPDVISDRVNTAELMMGILRLVHKIRRKIKKWNQDTMIRNRAEKMLRNIITDLGSETVDDKFATEIGTKLDALDKWFSPDQLYELYWPDLKRDINSLLVQADPEEFPDPQHKKTVDNLRKLIEQEPKKQNLRKATQIEEEYAKLKILWERKQNDDADALDQLFTLFKSGQTLNVDDFFKEADDIVWKRLKAACEKGEEGLEFTSPQKSTIHPLRAYQLIQFKVAPKDRKLSNNYLFKHGLEYHWSLKLEIGGKLEELTNPVTEEPRLIQYVPIEGKLIVSVKLRHNDDYSDEVMIKKPLTIKSSSDFGWRGTLQFVEVTGIIIATLLALISGLATWYVGKPSFGNAGDYIALFLWGAGVDQTKNFIQHLERSSSTGGTSP